MMSTMIATKRMAYQVAEDMFNAVAKQSVEYGGTIQPGMMTLLHVADIERKAGEAGLPSEYWTPFIVAALAEDGVFVAENGRICTPKATVFA